MGSGRSDIASYNEKRYGSLDGYAQDVLEICRELDRRDVIFVGHSVSGVIGMLAAIKEPRYFWRLVLIGPSPRYIDDPPGYTGGGGADIEGLLEMMDENYLAWASFLAPNVMKHLKRPKRAHELEQSFCSTDPRVARRLARVIFLSDGVGNSTSSAGGVLASPKPMLTWKSILAYPIVAISLTRGPHIRHFYGDWPITMVLRRLKASRLARRNQARCKCMNQLLPSFSCF